MDILLVITSKYSQHPSTFPSFPLEDSVSCKARGCQKATPCGLCGILSLGILGIPQALLLKGLKEVPSNTPFPPQYIPNRQVNNLTSLKPIYFTLSFNPFI